MGRKRSAGLYKREGVWHIDKRIQRIRICESTGERILEKAEAYLARKIEEVRQATVYGVRPVHLFREAASKYLNETKKRRLERDAQSLMEIDPYIGDMPLTHIRYGYFKSFY